MSEFIAAPAYRLYICPISDGAGSRRDREQEAVGTLIAEVFGPDTILAHTPEGAPFIVGHPDTKISISHSGSVCLLAVGQSPYINIGVDIESPRRQLLKVATRFLSAGEKRLADAAPDEDALLQILLKLWTVKEAVYKAALTPGLPLAEITVAPTFTAATARGNEFSITFHPLPDGQQIAVACKER